MLVGLKNKKYNNNDADDDDDDDDKELSRRIRVHAGDARKTSYLFQRISMALHRGNAVSFHKTMVTE